MALVDGQCQRFSDTLRSRRHHPTSLERGHHASHASSRHIIRRMRRLVCGSGRQIIGADRYNRSPISYWGRPDLPLLRAAVALRGVGKRTLHRCADDGTSSRQAPRGLCRQSQCGREGSFQVAAMPLPAMLAKLDELPEAIRTTVRNNGGGHANHSMFWQVMAAGAVSRPRTLRESLLVTLARFRSAAQTELQ